MALEWTFVYYLLITEVVIFALLCIPLPIRWRQAILSRIANSKTLLKLWPLALVVVAILSFLFFAALTEARATHREHEEHKRHNGYHHSGDMQTEIRMFRAQRNMYITGFALFLLVVLNRFYSLITELVRADVLASQARNQSETTVKALGDADKLKKENETLTQKLKESEEAKRKALVNVDNLVEQAKRNQAALDRHFEERQQEAQSSAPAERKKDK
ncbi:hypothetical protein CAOG_06202 [Capsaspora owczarzaki ATCC 30864]|uniref:Endoplasmic reticulum transmembrane protein n=1 Tax=Capsaspora owczarzaki (strain ATCC 30864) TaxID=595528 RepID=A0A0D2UL16_CAPO3|nr:hypothetical protein CAOG_06202 [Capsaspora owczarzaki ATCC 30864]KJE95786.1 hypothetical protein CAOG_006202 [Capsaspora owczarzaki ATCC 30864]|eukprot:XP_004345792.1 hypothetical protein CAOG_06202 [Capsaspora owczarzaki ATCC 30864]